MPKILVMGKTSCSAGIATPIELTDGSTQTAFWAIRSVHRSLGSGPHRKTPSIPLLTSKRESPAMERHASDDDALTVLKCSRMLRDLPRRSPQVKADGGGGRAWTKYPQNQALPPVLVAVVP